MTDADMHIWAVVDTGGGSKCNPLLTPWQHRGIYAPALVGCVCRDASGECDSLPGLPHAVIHREGEELPVPIARNGLSWFSRNLIEFLPPLFMSAASMRLLLRSNGRQPMLWGRTSDLGQIAEKFCASRKLFRPDGTYLPHAETPMGWVLRTGLAARDRKIVIERPDGSRVTVLVNIAPLFDKHGLQIGAVNCFQDLRAQKLSEKKRERLHDELHQSKKMEAVGQLTGGLAHAINNLRAGITASPDLLQIRIRQGRVNDLERFT